MMMMLSDARNKTKNYFLSWSCYWENGTRWSLWFGPSIPTEEGADGGEEDTMGRNDTATDAVDNGGGHGDADEPVRNCQHGHTHTQNTSEGKGMEAKKKHSLDPPLAFVLCWCLVRCKHTNKHSNECAGDESNHDYPFALLLWNE